ncbi:hypothetical protein [Nostoc sp. MS1]|nr:hypothetical protein [Nostoc sp. MS1]
MNLQVATPPQILPDTTGGVFILSMYLVALSYLPEQPQASS